MQNKPDVQVGDQVQCAQTIGMIGDSGNALNPHLHLEVRVGPEGARFPALAHYETRVKPEEMEAYCTWRVSGIFQPVDPTRLFTAERDP